MAVVGNVKQITNTDGNSYLFEDENGRRMIANEFDSTQTYAVGDIVEYDNKLYKFTSAHAAGAFIPAEATQIKVVDVMGDADKVAYTDVTDAFDATKSYDIGDICIYENALYKFKVAHAAGAWSAADVDAIKIADIIQKTSFKVENEALVIEQSTY